MSRQPEFSPKKRVRFSNPLECGPGPHPSQVRDVVESAPKRRVAAELTMDPALAIPQVRDVVESASRKRVAADLTMNRLPESGKDYPSYWPNLQRGHYEAMTSAPVRREKPRPRSVSQPPTGRQEIWHWQLQTLAQSVVVQEVRAELNAGLDVLVLKELVSQNHLKAVIENLKIIHDLNDKLGDFERRPNDFFE